MATTTSQKSAQKSAQIPDDVKMYVNIVLDALKRALETNNFTLEIYNEYAVIKIPDIKAIIDRHGLYIMYKDIDVVYSDYVVRVKVYRDPYDFPDEYYAHDYWATLEDLYQLAREVVKDRLENVLIWI